MAGALASNAARIAGGSNNGYSGSQNNNGDGVLAVGWGVYEIAAQTLAATYNAVSGTGFTQYQDGANHSAVRWFYWLTPATGANTLTITGLSTDRNGGLFAPTNGTADIPTDSDGTSGTGVTSLTRTVTTIAGDLVLGIIAIAAAADPVMVASGDAVEHSEGLANAGDFLWNWNASFVANDTSADIGATWTNAGNSSLSVITMGQAPAVSAALTGTIASACTEQDIRTGGKTLILTLTGDTWVAAGATFDAQRQNIINGIDSGQAEAAGYDAVVKAGLPVTAVVRTSNTVVTLTYPAFSTYQITATETITATIPGSALSGGNPLVASPTFTITRGADDLVQPVGATNASGVPATSSGSLTSDAVGLTRITASFGGTTGDTAVVITKR